MELRNGYPILPVNKRKKILLLCDDIRMNSGIATMGKEIVLGTCHQFNWVNLGAAINHPEKGKGLNLDDFVRKETQVSDAKLTIYPNDGYGNTEILKNLIEIEKPDAILAYTDPRFWGFLWGMEHEIRQNIPIMYYNIWDDLPYPQYNEEYYKSCDLIMNISKQTHNIVKQVLGKDNWANMEEEKGLKTLIDYIPHGIDSQIYKPLGKNNIELNNFRERLFRGKEYNFVIYYQNRNIRRKMPSDLMTSYKFFCDTLTKEQRDKVLLIYKTTPIDNNGTDLPKTKADLLPDEYNVLFMANKLSAQEMNFMYNIADVGMNISSAEGFGLSNAEALMAGTPVITNCIGGLQDQCRFEDENGNWIDFDSNHPTNSDKKYTKHGEWCFPVWPQLNMVGSPPTPYIYDSRAEVGDVVEKLIELYNLDWVDRKSLGLKGREWLMSEESRMSATKMSEFFIKDINIVIAKFIPKGKWDLYKIEKKRKLKKVGLYDKHSNTWK